MTCSKISSFSGCIHIELRKLDQLISCPIDAVFQGMCHLTSLRVNSLLQCSNSSKDLLGGWCDSGSVFLADVGINGSSVETSKVKKETDIIPSGC